MSFLSALFGRLAPASVEKIPEPVEYKGFIIRAAPYRAAPIFNAVDRRLGSAGFRCCRRMQLIRQDGAARP